MTTQLRIAQRDDGAYDIIGYAGAQVAKAATRNVAVLFAAAPDLLAALKTSESLLRRLRPCNRDFIQEIDAAIVKASAALREESQS